MDQESEKIIVDRIKRMFKKFTDDFSNEDIEFIRLLIYPLNIKVINYDLEEEDPNRTRSVDVECLSDIESLFKKLPENCEVVIPSITGKMRLVSRV